ncbi:MAG TPA: hypothetical protein VGM27_29035 [Acidobacteriaceae bacterium]
MRRGVTLTLAIFLLQPLHLLCNGQQPAGLQLIRTVTLPGYSGDFDHFALDGGRSRVLLAAEDHATLEVFDLKSGDHLQTIRGFDTPHSILVRPGSPTIFVTDSGPSMSKLLDANDYTKKGAVKLVAGADSSVYDQAANILFVVTGGKDVEMSTAGVEAVNPDNGEVLGKISFNDNHVEAMAIEKHGDRLFVNLTQTNKLAVVNRKTMKEIAEWPISPAQQNAMVAFDEAAHRLYVVCRKPGMVVVLNSDNGSVIGTQPAPLRSDDVMFDPSAHRLYVPGGEGYIGVYDTSDPDHLKMMAKVPSAPGAKTGLLLPDRHELLLAASPGDTKAVAKVLTFRVE